MINEYFVGEVYFKQETGNSANIQAENIAPFIKLACLGWTQNILGSYFMNDLLVKYNAETLSTDEAALVLQIKPAISWRAASDIIEQTSVKMSNKGANKQFSDYSESVDDVTLGNKIALCVKRAEFYETYLIKYLEKNKDLFTAFLSESNDDSIVKPKDGDSTNFTSFISFV